MPPRALLLVDLQNDFCAGGALAVPEGDSTVDVANRLIDWCQSRGEAVIASQDWHPANHGSFASQHGVEPYTPGQLDGLPQTFWPDHCVQNSEGAQLHPLLHQKAIAAVFHKGENPLVDSYSAFFDNGRRQKTSLDDWLRDHEIDELIVMGLATDYWLSWREYPAPGQCARVYGDVSSWGNAIYAGRLGRDTGVILRWPTILYWHCRPNKTRQWHIWQLMPSTKDLIHLRNLFQRHLPRFDAKNGENQRTEQ